MYELFLIILTGHFPSDNPSKTGDNILCIKTSFILCQTGDGQNSITAEVYTCDKIEIRTQHTTLANLEKQ